MLALAGWSIVHALWVGPLLAAALLLWFHTRATSAAHRCSAALMTLALMVVAPITIAVTTADPLVPTVRMVLTSVVDSSVGFAEFLGGRRVLVPAAAVLWLTGVLVGLVRVARQWRVLRTLRATSNPAGGRANNVLTQVQLSRPVRGRVTLANSESVRVPMVFGLQHPLLLLPRDAGDTLSDTQLHGIVIHELAHVQRRDYVWNLAQTALDIVLWFNPAARWVSRQARLYREVCCDEEVVKAGISAHAYASALASLDASADDHSLAIAASSGTLVERIARLAGRPQRRSHAHVAGLVTAALVFAATVFGAAFTIPPGIDLNAQLRQRAPGPAGDSMPTGPTFPRRPAGQ